MVAFQKEKPRRILRSMVNETLTGRTAPPVKAGIAGAGDGRALQASSEGAIKNVPKTCPRAPDRHPRPANSSQDPSKGPQKSREVTRGCEPGRAYREA